MTWAGSYRAAPAVQDFTSATTFAVNKATGTVAGDLILWGVAGSTGATTFTCPGFASQASAVPYYGQLLTRTADGTESSTFTVTSTGGATPAEITQATIAGPCSIDVVGALNWTGTTANPTATGLTVAGSNELLLWFGSSIISGGNGTPVATTIPSGFTSRVTGTPGTYQRPTQLLCDNTAVAAGATGAVASVNAATNNWTAQMVAIKPVAYTGPVYRAAPAVQDFTSATTYAVNKAAGTVAGDLILLWCGGNASGNGAFTCPGFANQTGSPFTSRGQLLTRTADGTEGSTFTVTSTAGATPAEVVQATVAGPCSIDVVGAVAAASTANPTATGLTVAGANELLLWFGGAFDASINGTLVASAMPSGFTSRATGTAGTSQRPDMLLCDNTAVAAGATGSVAATNATTTGYWDAQMVAIKPVAYTGPVYRATPAVQDFASATTYAVNKATGTVAGDLILLYCTGNGVAPTCPGFANYSGGAYDFTASLLVRTADGTEGSTFTLTNGTSAAAEILQATVAGPCSIDVVGAATAGAASANPTATGLTVAGANELLLWFGSAETTGSVGAVVATTVPSGFTSRVTGTSGTSSRPDTLLCDNTAVAAGATGSIAATNATSQFWQTLMVAIKPVAYTGPVYRAAPAVQDFTSATTFAVNKATGTVAGDLILLWCAGSTGATTFTCPGFACQASAVPYYGQLLTRTAHGTESSTFTVTSTGGATPAESTQATIAGPCSIDVVGALNWTGTTANPTATGLTVAGSNELLL